MAASMADGKTVLENAAEEPEIVDLATYLNSMGANIRGAGTNVIRIEGVKELHGANHAVIPDRIEAGTFIVGAAMTQGNVFVENAISEHLKPLISKLKEVGAEVRKKSTASASSAMNRFARPISRPCLIPVSRQTCRPSSWP